MKTQWIRCMTFFVVAAWSQGGAAASLQYSGDGLTVTPLGQGARLRCALQSLEGEATREGLWMASTRAEPPGGHFRVNAVAVEGKGQTLLSATGEVSVEGPTVRFIRPGLVEEYRVSVDGVQQDFVVLEKPEPAPGRPLADCLTPLTNTELRVELAVSGARAEQTSYGAQLVLEQSERRIAYSRLKVTDARGKELPARIEVYGDRGTCGIAGAAEPIAVHPSACLAVNKNSEISLAVVVDDAEAVYPLRIDPTFSDANWVSLGGIAGADSTIDVAVVDGAGNLYIGGSFSLVGDMAANGIAKWNGSAWSALGSGMNGYVSALAVSGSNLYAGGSFTTADGIAATNIAQWNGRVWSSLGAGIGGPVSDPLNPPMVSALAVSGGNLYAGGSFTNAGGIAATNIAQWNGTVWSALGSGVGGGSASYPPVVRALAVSGSDVYAGGDFTIAGGIAANSIAKWDGNAWSALGSGMGGGMAFFSDGVYALAVSGTNLYAGGYFTTAGGSPATTIAQWDGSAWSAVGSGTNGISFPASGVVALAVSGNDLYAAWITNILCAAGGCGGGGAAIAKWNGSSWSTLVSESTWQAGNLPTPAIYALAASGSDLFVGGNFTMIGGTPANYLAKWDGNSWSEPASGMNSSVSALAVSCSNVYAGGSFLTAGGVAANHIAQWDGSAWSALGSGMNGYVSALAVSGNKLYAGGSFTTAGSGSANYIAQWDGSAWSALNSGLDNPVYALALVGSNLYAGGIFTTADGMTANKIAKWDGIAWSVLGSGMNDTVYAMAASGGNLYVGGWFTTAGGTPANHVAKWDGSTWSALGSGLNQPVVAMAVSGSNVYVGGYFTTAGGIPANYVAKWDGTAWHGLGQGINNSVMALALSGSDLYAGGSFITAGEIAAAHVAKWDGSAWSALGSGVDGTYQPSVNALAVSGNDLYVGGSFTMAGGKVSAYVAKALIGPPPFYFVSTNTSLGFSKGQFYFTLLGPAGSNAVVFASTNLQSWAPLVTNPLIGGSLNFTDALATNFTRRFYRALLQP